MTRISATPQCFTPKTKNPKRNRSAQVNAPAALPAKPGFQLAWNDEFDVSGPIDQSKWSHMIAKPGTVNQELQAYTDQPENCRVENGNLVIECRRNGNDYTSARIHSQHKGDWTYGRMEAKIKLPKGKGTWPAFWMMPTDPSKYATNWNPATGWDTPNCDAWPNSGEIDIMEHVGFEPDLIHGSAHSKKHNFKTHSERKNTIRVPDCEDNFHVYAVEWFPDRIDYFVDDQKYHTIQKGNDNWEGYPFDQKFHVMLNLAFGGIWGGLQGIDNSIFDNPEGVKMLVDYVRVFKGDAASSSGTPPVRGNADWLKQQINALPHNGGEIEIPAGTYDCNFEINKPNVKLKAKQGGEVKLVSSQSPPLTVSAPGFAATGITVENTNPSQPAVKLQLPNGHQTTPGCQLENCIIKGSGNALSVGTDSEPQQPNDIVIRGGEIAGSNDAIKCFKNGRLKIEDAKLKFNPPLQGASGSNSVIASRGEVDLTRCEIQWTGSNQPTSKNGPWLARPWIIKDNGAGAVTYSTEGKVRGHQSASRGLNYHPDCFRPNQGSNYHWE